MRLEVEDGHLKGNNNVDSDCKMLVVFMSI